MAEGAIELWAEAPDPARFPAHDVGGMEDPGTVHDCTTDRCDPPRTYHFAGASWGIGPCSTGQRWALFHPGALAFLAYLIDLRPLLGPSLRP
jgi:hypothetical protein